MFSRKGKMEGPDEVIIVEMISDGKRYGSGLFGANRKRNSVKNMHKQS